MSNEYAIGVLKESLHFYETECSPEKMCTSAWLDVVKKMSAFRLAIEALENQEREKWRPINPDDPDSFPDNDRFVLVSFSNLEVVNIARWRADTEGGMFCHLDEDYSYSRYSMFVNAWKELPKRWTDGSDR